MLRPWSETDLNTVLGASSLLPKSNSVLPGNGDNPVCMSAFKLLYLVSRGHSCGNLYALVHQRPWKIPKFPQFFNFGEPVKVMQTLGSNINCSTFCFFCLEMINTNDFYLKIPALWEVTLWSVGEILIGTCSAYPQDRNTNHIKIKLKCILSKCPILRLDKTDQKICSVKSSKKCHGSSLKH